MKTTRRDFLKIMAQAGVAVVATIKAPSFLSLLSAPKPAKKLDFSASPTLKHNSGKVVFVSTPWHNDDLIDSMRYMWENCRKNAGTPDFIWMPEEMFDQHIEEIGTDCVGMAGIKGLTVPKPTEAVGWNSTKTKDWWRETPRALKPRNMRRTGINAVIQTPPLISRKS